MPAIQYTKSLSALAFAVGVSALMLMPTSGNASTTSQLMQCKGPNKNQVVACCNQVLNKKKKPLWMITADQSCSEAVACRRVTVGTSITHVSSNTTLVCRLVIAHNTPGGEGGKKEPAGGGQFNPTRGQRN